MPPRPHPPLLMAHQSLMPVRPNADLHSMGESQLMCLAGKARVAENQGCKRTETGLDG
jgi:hypothetical protein